MVSGGKVVLTAGGSELTGVNLQEHFSRKFGIPVRAVNDMNAVAAADGAWPAEATAAVSVFIWAKTAWGPA